MSSVELLMTACETYLKVSDPKIKAFCLEIIRKVGKEI
jgi:hypothetical protein